MQTKIYDATTIKAYLRCPRYYFFRMRKHWTSDSPKPALVFGLSMHKAMEEIYGDVAKSTAESALEAFTLEWLKSDLDPQEYHPRSIPRAKQILTAYFERYGDEIEQTEVLGVEVPFTVELTDDVVYGGRLDAVVVLPYVSGAIVLEHKTSSSFRSSWTNGFNPDTQISGYAVGIRSFYEEARGQVMVNGILVQKSTIDFLRVPLMPSMSALEAWRWEVADTVEEIKYENERFDNENVGFRRNPEACTMWGACEYLDLCQAIPTTAEWNLEECPQGFHIEEWDYTLKMQKLQEAQNNA